MGTKYTSSGDAVHNSEVIDSDLSLSDYCLLKLTLWKSIT